MSRINYRRIVLIFADLLIIAASGATTYLLLSTVGVENISGKRALLASAMGTIIGFFCLYISGAYFKLWRYFKLKDYLSCFIGVGAGVVISALLVNWFEKELPLVFWVTFFLISIIGVVVFRLLFRGAFLSVESKKNEELKKRTLIVGAGNACRMLLAEMKQNSLSPFEPVCIVDDDANKFRSKIEHISVEGNSDDIPRLCLEREIETIMFAIPSSTPEERRRILAVCESTNVEIKIIPYLSELLFSDQSILGQIKDVQIEDLLGRDPVKFDDRNVAALVRGKVCMVTGGGGSIGSELCRQIAKYSPEKLVIVDIYENNVYEIQQELLMEYGDRLNMFSLIASVRDYDKMRLIFETYRPQIVFHAAAHKHVPLMETVPEEAVKNNVFGTFNTARLAEEFKADKFVLISTDKAVNPTNVMGATKRCCEMIVQYMAQNRKHTEFVAVRFGNVLGSNGSVIPLFKKQIESGKPVTVTHKDIIRYFMTIPEAVSLVLQAGTIARGSEIFVLDMGEPVKILTLAENLIRQYGKIPYKDVKIRFTGLRPGEKLYEELLMNEEGLQSTGNNKIFIGSQIEIDNDEFLKNLDSLRESAEQNNSALTVERLAKMVPTFRHMTNEK